MNFLKIFLSVLAGFLLCYLLLPARPVRASIGGSYIRVNQVKIGGSAPFGEHIPGDRIVGFSCTGAGSDTQCFVASQDASN
jgi:hypothetical protein